MMSMDGVKIPSLTLKVDAMQTIDLSRDKEPQIYDAIKFGAILENIGFKMKVPRLIIQMVHYRKHRVSYPIDHIKNIVLPSKEVLQEYLLFNL